MTPERFQYYVTTFAQAAQSSNKSAEPLQTALNIANKADLATLSGSFATTGRDIVNAKQKLIEEVKACHKAVRDDAQSLEPMRESFREVAKSIQPLTMQEYIQQHEIEVTETFAQLSTIYGYPEVVSVPEPEPEPETHGNPVAISQTQIGGAISILRYTYQGPLSGIAAGLEALMFATFPSGETDGIQVGNITTTTFDVGFGAAGVATSTRFVGSFPATDNGIQLQTFNLEVPYVLS